MVGWSVIWTGLGVEDKLLRDLLKDPKEWANHTHKYETFSLCSDGKEYIKLHVRNKASHDILPFAFRKEVSVQDKKGEALREGSEKML